ncbi:hypothetical protein A4G19_08425 [Pasteurellaceae bacterium Macca]|nr:hypothetical protein [Pasteurellaceae bacterium Macca]
MKQITKSLKNVVVSGKWSEEQQAITAVADSRYQPMISPFERAVIKQLARDWEDETGETYSESRVGRELIRKALGLSE